MNKPTLTIGLVGATVASLAALLIAATIPAAVGAYLLVSPLLYAGAALLALARAGRTPRSRPAQPQHAPGLTAPQPHAAPAPLVITYAQDAPSPEPEPTPAPPPAPAPPVRAQTAPPALPPLDSFFTPAPRSMFDQPRPDPLPPLEPMPPQPAQTAPHAWASGARSPWDDDEPAPPYQPLTTTPTPAPSLNPPPLLPRRPARPEEYERIAEIYAETGNLMNATIRRVYGKKDGRTHGWIKEALNL